MKATFNFLTKRTQQCPFEMSSRSPTSPGAFSPSEPCQKQLNIRKLFEGLFHISRNPIISRSLTMSSHLPSRAVTMPSVALGRLEVTSRCPALGTARLVGSTRRGTCRGPCLRLFAQAQVCIVSLAAVSWGEVRCYAVSGQRARALRSTLSSQRIKAGQKSREDRLTQPGRRKGFHALGTSSSLESSTVQQCTGLGARLV